MNNVYFGRNEKLQSRNRSGMIRSYRTTRTLWETLTRMFDLLLAALDHALDVMARPVVRRVVRGIVAIACIGGFLCLISAVESRLLSMPVAGLIALVLVVIEIACLRGNS